MLVFFGGIISVLGGQLTLFLTRLRELRDWYICYYFTRSYNFLHKTYSTGYSSILHKFLLMIIVRNN